MKLKLYLVFFFSLAVSYVVFGSEGDFRVSIDNGWTFALGDAAYPKDDYGYGTEYFTGFAKVRFAGQYASPAKPGFDDSQWSKVNLPHDWVVDLPYSGEASHSHGYKCVGWKYPENSAGWYRRHLNVPAEDEGRQIWVEFEGIFRNSEVFCNGCYLGGEKSGYSSRMYDLSPYLNYGGDNVITVRCEASVEEGWYYEGAGIYRHVWIHKAGPVAAKPYSIKVDADSIVCDFSFSDSSVDPSKVSSETAFFDPEGKEVKVVDHLWSISDPFLYTWRLRLLYDGAVSAEYSGHFGVRDAKFDPSRGFLLNGEPVELKGCNLHLDHAGVGVAVPDALWRYRLERLKDYGFNAIRCSHNCASPAMLDLCDVLGFVVIDENRQFGVNEEQLGQFRNMIERDRNHPSVVLWSVGNEEWSVEFSKTGKLIAEKMTAFAHSIDPTRLTTYGNCSGDVLVEGVDVFGYNYIVQNKIEELRKEFPDHCAVGTEETSGAGTRGHYETVPSEGWMTPLNRIDTLGRINVIEYGWKFYKERPWATGLFYWTGQDYRGEPNPMVWPATGSQFGIFDYCCYPKDEAFYLKSVWTPEPTVHICGPYNGEVWVYSNCDSVSLSIAGRNLGTKPMPKDSHLVWKLAPPASSASSSAPLSASLPASLSGSVSASGSPASSASSSAPLSASLPASDSLSFLAKGYIEGKIVVTDKYPATHPALTYETSKNSLRADGQDIIVIDIFSDEPSLEVIVENATFLGWGNGNPGFKEIERPSMLPALSRASLSGSSSQSSDHKSASASAALRTITHNSLTVNPFAGRVQILVRSIEDSSGKAAVTIAGHQLTFDLLSD